MTNNQLTREENIQAVFDLKAGYKLGLADVEILKRVASMALAAMDSEPNRNPVLAYADSYRDMAKQGVESVPIWSVITDLERNIAPLYRHAQPAPVVPDEKAITPFFDTIALDTAKMVMCDVNRRSDFLGGDIQLLARIQCRVDEACRAAMLAQPVSQGYKLVPVEPTEDMQIAAREWSRRKYGIPIGSDASIGCYEAMLAAAPEGGNDTDTRR